MPSPATDGQVRLLYGNAAQRERTVARQRELVQRALAYAEAALRDYQHYEGRTAADEAAAQGLIDRLVGALGS
jgi:hypothetical protein